MNKRLGYVICNRTVIYSLSLVLTVLGATTPMLAQLSGAYTIDGARVTGGTNYQSFTEAVAALATSGVSGHVTFSVAEGTFTEAITIPAIPTASSGSTITFDGGNGNATTRILRNDGTSQPSTVVHLDGADWITFSNLTIESTSAISGIALLFTNGADHNTVEGCVLRAPATGECLRASATITSNYGIATANYARIANNMIDGGTYGVIWFGYEPSDETHAVYNSFIGNTIKNFTSRGMYFNSGNYLTCTHNTVRQLWNEGTGQPAVASSRGIEVYYQNHGPNISYNDIQAGSYPLYIENANYRGGSTDRAKIVNNMLVATSASDQNYGLYLSSSAGVDVWHNSILLHGKNYCYGVRIYGTVSTGLDIRNNVIACSSATSLYQYLFYQANTANAYIAFDHNLFYSPNPDAKFVYLNTTYSWNQLPRSTHNAHSRFGDPYFAGPYDLHSESSDTYRTGAPISTVADDIDGDARHATMPCIGADEYRCAVICPSDIAIVNDPLLCGATVYFAPETTVPCGEVICTPPSGTFFPKGNTVVTCATGDGLQCTFNVTVIDAEVPVITLNTPVQLWPIDQGYTTISVAQMVAAISDNCDMLSVSEVTITGASSDEAETGNGAGNTLNDMVIAAACQSIDLRKERIGSSNGRVYNVALQVQDHSGNLGTAIFKAYVPHSLGQPWIEDEAVYFVNGPCGTPKNSVVVAAIDGYALEQNFPNPFNPSTRIRFTLPLDMSVTLSVYDVFGRLVATLVEETKSKGSYAMEFDGRKLPSGIYLCRLEAGKVVLQRKMALIK